MMPAAVDLFAGAGGATQGLRDAGFVVVGAVENDLSAANTYAANHPEVRLWRDDIRRIPARKMARELGLSQGELGLLKACPPCQGFSSLAVGRSVPNAAQNDLVVDTIRFIRAFRPSAVIIENVPGLGRDERATRVLSALQKMGYASRQYRVDAAQFGVPQRRRRLIVIAIKGLRTVLPEALPAQDPLDSATVQSAFDALARVLRDDDPLNIARKLTPAVQARVAAVPVNGTRFDLPVEHQLACHRRTDASARSATASYGRLKAHRPAPTLTTRCTTPSCGSFIHPTEHRGITLREAATLQSFPHDYQFKGTYGEIERQIGNAVPVKMAEALARVVLGLSQRAV